MFVVHFLYPSIDGSTFDMDYYVNAHMPLLVQALGSSCIAWGCDEVLDEQYHAVAWIHASSREDFDSVMKEHGATIRADVANYTAVRPLVIAGMATGGPGPASTRVVG